MKEINLHISIVVLIATVMVFAAAANANAQTTTTTATNNTQNIPSAESAYSSKSMTIPTGVGSFIWYIVNEAHEDTNKESQKIISTHNPNYLPTNIVIPQGVAISFLNADAPWDTPHPHTINIKEDNNGSSGKVVYTTGKMDYTKIQCNRHKIPMDERQYNCNRSKKQW